MTHFSLCNDNSKKIILDLCGGTGAWSKPYAEAGYDVRLITLPGNDIFTYSPPDKVYGILAAPPCTMFSLARTTAKTARNFEVGMRVVKRCLEIIWDCRCKNKLAFWALENPFGYLRQFLGKPVITFNPMDYGDSYSKKTDLWGYFNEPKLSKRTLTDEELQRCKINNRILPDLPDDYILPKGLNRQAARRSITSKYFAKAFFEVNK